MTPAHASMRPLPDPFLTIITDEGLSADAVTVVVARACSEAGPVIQVRVRHLAGARMLALAERLRTITREHGCLLVVNDRIDVALAVDADGAHLPGAAMASDHARTLVGTTRLLGRSVHSLEEIRREKALGAVDYLQFGPVFATPSKAAYGEPQGLEHLARAVAIAAPLPVIAVGGITSDNVPEVMRAGASGVAVIAAVMRADDPCARTRELASRTSVVRRQP